LRAERFGITENSITSRASIVLLTERKAGRGPHERHSDFIAKVDAIKVAESEGK
jgi:hypothetical protein